MRWTPHPERTTAFEKTAARLGLIHAKSRPYAPWQNGIVERSHRSDNEELFQVQRFESSEERRYQLWLYNAYRNWERPHQGLNGQTPAEVFHREYPLHYGAMNY